MSAEKGAAPPQDFLADLERRNEILPTAKLHSLQELSERDELTDDILVEEIGERGVFLIAFSLAAADEPKLLQAAQGAYVSGVTELRAHIQATAPALLVHPRIQTLARRISEKAGQDDDTDEDRRVPFDDLKAVGFVTTFFDFEDGLVPLTRAAIEFSNRAAISPLSLRLSDVTFLASALIASLAEALESSDRIAKAGLLDHSEVDAVRKRITKLGGELNRVMAALERPSLVEQSTGQIVRP